MEKRKAKRIYVKESAISKRQLEKWRAQIADELPDLIRRNKLADDAMREKTFSGRLRRAIHEFPRSSMKIAETAGISWEDLDDFLTGEKTLPSDAIDRLVRAVKLKLPGVKSRRAKAG
jgi:pyoverdine/dityrosine biosynthesis protein Dit1